VSGFGMPSYRVGAVGVPEGIRTPDPEIRNMGPTVFPAFLLFPEASVNH
jgi:hypothetical protein